MKETAERRFRVALSFPGEHRDYVREVAEFLARELTPQKVFYDEWYEAELLGIAGDIKLRSMYDQADLVVPFFSKYYAKPWCALEWETIREILLLRRRDDAIIPVHLDATPVPGWSAVNFGIKENGRSPQQIAQLLVTALSFRDRPTYRQAPDEPTQYFCYVSEPKIEQLFDTFSQSSPPNAVDKQEIEPGSSLGTPQIAYGRPDLFQRDSVRKRRIAQRLQHLLRLIDSSIHPFDWMADPTDHSLFRCRFSFIVNAIDEASLMAELVATSNHNSLTLHCSLSNFSHATISEGKPSFQSTNYGFFKAKHPVTFESIFLLTSRSGDHFYGSPIFLKLPIRPGLSL